VGFSLGFISNKLILTITATNPPELANIIRSLDRFLYIFILSVADSGDLKGSNSFLLEISEGPGVECLPTVRLWCQCRLAHFISNNQTQVDFYCGQPFCHSEVD
jgi:hypothetical protein